MWKYVSGWFSYTLLINRNGCTEHKNEGEIYMIMIMIMIEIQGKALPVNPIDT